MKNEEKKEVSQDTQKGKAETKWVEMMYKELPPSEPDFTNVEPPGAFPF